MRGGGRLLSPPFLRSAIPADFSLQEGPPAFFPDLYSSVCELFRFPAGTDELITFPPRQRRILSSLLLPATWQPFYVSLSPVFQEFLVPRKYMKIFFLTGRSLGLCVDRFSPFDDLVLFYFTTSPYLFALSSSFSHELFNLPRSSVLPFACLTLSTRSEVSAPPWTRMGSFR